MNIESLIKKIFPTYKIYNATDKSEQQMQKIIDICINIDNLIVFKLRNDKNSSFFKTYEEKHKLKRNIGIIFFNKDDYIYFENGNDETYNVKSFEGCIRFLKNFIEDNCSCCICYEEFDSEKRNTISCGKCGSSCCTKCIFNMSSRNDNVICPMCRSCTLVCHI